MLAELQLIRQPMTITNCKSCLSSDHQSITHDRIFWPLQIPCQQSNARYENLILKTTISTSTYWVWHRRTFLQVSFHNSQQQGSSKEQFNYRQANKTNINFVEKQW